MDEITIKTGDSFLYKSKYGGIVTGTISGIFEMNVYDMPSGTIYKEYNILSENKIPYALTEIHIIARFMDLEEQDRLKRIFSKK